ncbi:MAG: hypothetical protein LQ352_008333 [Teloschistes flavicans]|nr:MAG: hypothetical protein LQ352_008333 [Teloschistes flavicans]
MTGITNSSIQPWLDFDGRNLPASIPSCRYIDEGADAYRNLSTTDCGRVCGSTQILYSTSNPNNLFTCGLWITSTLNYYDAGKTQFWEDLLVRFEGLGLNSSNVTQAYAARNAISTTMYSLEQASVLNTYQSGSSSHGSCSEQALFPDLFSVHEPNLPKYLHKCVNTICAPPSLNPDIGGIGVFISLLMQLCIAMLVLFAILYIAFGLPMTGRRRRVQMINLFAALVEFHKAQCYFISIVQIAALVVARQAYHYSWKPLAPTPPVYDILLSIPLAMNGIIPVIFTLSCISLYSRLSWHIIGLTSVAFTLSSTTLVLVNKWMMLLVKKEKQERDVVDFRPDTLAQSVCGSKA